MLSGQRSAWRRRGRSRAARLAVPLAIPMAMGLTLGIILAVSGGHITKIDQSAMPAAASPSAGASGAATPKTAVVAAVPPAPSNASGQTAFRQLGNLATVPVDGAGNAINLNQTAAEATASMNCTLAVPANPLSAQGLATPWQLGDGCSMANAATEGAFVEATILAPNGQVQVYNPLVVTAGTTAAAPPVAPTIARGSQVIIDVGFNGTNLVLQGQGARQGRCVDALGQSVIGQVSACNAVNFYNLANFEIARGTLTVPPAGTSARRPAVPDHAQLRRGRPGPERQRDHLVPDQRQRPDRAEHRGQRGRERHRPPPWSTAATTSCSPPSSTRPTGARRSARPTPPTRRVPLVRRRSTSSAPASTSRGRSRSVPPNDEMTLVNGAFSIAKTNVYRSLVDQPMLPANANATQVAADYCQNLVNIQPARNLLDMTSGAEDR